MYDVSSAFVSILVRTVLTRSFESVQCVEAIIEVLNRVEETAKEFPPVDNKASRFGNPAFRSFYDKIGQVRDHLCGASFAVS